MRKKRYIFVCLFLLAGLKVEADQYAYQVNFTDKKGTSFSLTSPQYYLSLRAIVRRLNQTIPIDSSDLPLNRKYIDSVLTLTGGTFHEESRWLNACVILVSDSVSIHSLDTISFVSATKFIGYYTPYLHFKPAHTTKNFPPKINSQNRTTNDASYYGNTWEQTNMVNGSYLHDLGLNGTGKLIAVLDAGFTDVNTHPGFDSLWLSGRIVDTYNFVLHNNNVFSYDTHGMEVLSTLAGYVPGQFVGTAPMAEYALYVTEYDPNDQPVEMFNMLSSVERADSIGADVISESVGYDLFLNPGDGLNFSSDCDGKTTIAAIAANIATKKGMLFVATAGNDGGGWPGYGNHILTPGDADSALTIGSVMPTGTPAYSSGYGPNAAGQIKPDVCGVGQPANIFTNSYPTLYATGGGTSFSTPQIAGWAACLWQGKPSATPNELKNAIRKCASQFTSPQDQLGYGIPNFQCTANLLSVKEILFSDRENWVGIVANPFSVDLSLVFNLESIQKISYSIADISGNILIKSDVVVDSGYSVPVTISTAELPRGIYVLKVVSPTQEKVLKVVRY